MQKVLQSLYNGKLDNALLSLIGKTLVKNMQDNFKGIIVDYTTPDIEMLTRLTRDVWHFSAAKNHKQMRDLTLLLKDENGKLRSFSDFKEATKNVIDKYNVNWMKTEYNFSVAASQNAARWSQFTAEKKSIPNLKYQTAGDDAVREAHQLLDGKIQPVDSHFWSSHYPPNGWGCRCEAVQAPGTKPTPAKDIPTINIPKIFKTNLAKQGLIYPKNHPYYIGIPDAELRKAIVYLPPDNTYLSVLLDTHTIDIHPLHGKNELSKNLDNVALILKHDSKAKIKLLPTLQQQDMPIKDKFYSKKYIQKFKNKCCDIQYNSIFVELKNPSGSIRSIKEAISEGKEQAEIIIIKVNQITKENINAVYGQLNHYKNDKTMKVILLSEEKMQVLKRKRE